MASVSTYLNFEGKTEEAFNFYQKIFGGEFEGGFMRMGDVPQSPGDKPIPDDEKNQIMHVSLPIMGGHRLMGTDVTKSSGFSVTFGNSTYINIAPDSRSEVDRLFKELSAGGVVEMAPADMFWGDYFASCRDCFGICWMINFTDPAKKAHS
jgi:PhnB protein